MLSSLTWRILFFIMYNSVYLFDVFCRSDCFDGVTQMRLVCFVEIWWIDFLRNLMVGEQLDEFVNPYLPQNRYILVLSSENSM